MTKINSIGAGPITVANGGTGSATLTGLLVGNGTSAVTASTSPSVSGSVTAGTTITATLGNITATNGNFVASTAGTGLSFPVTTASGAQSGTVNCNGRAGSCTFTTVSIAAGATLTFVIGNTSVTGSGTIVLVSMRGATSGTAPVIQSVVNSANTTTIVVTNGTTVTTDVANKTFDFLVLN